MNSFVNDHRFSRAFSDPRFRPMPTLQKKVKIDKRFKAVLSSKDYGHRVLLDKRGRPIHDVSKRGKHEMERYYQISSDDSSCSDDDVDNSDDPEAKFTKHSQDEAEESASETDSDSHAAKPSLKTKQVKGAKSDKKSVKKTKNNNREDELVLKKNKKKASADKKKLSSRPVADEDEQKIEKISPKKRLKKKENGVAVSDQKNLSSKKRSLEEEEEDEDDRFETDRRFRAKRLKEMEEEEVSDDEVIDDEEEEETSSESDESSSDEEEEVECEEEVETSQGGVVPVMKKASTVEHKWNELHKNAPIVSDSTHRLAVCNMDWDFVKAQDLFVLFKSFVGEGGSVRSVNIYPSEFGKERMAEDAILGPREMRGRAVVEESQSDSEEEEEDENRSKKKHRRIDSEILKRKAKQEVRSANEALRGYQMNRLRYYFAVVDCNSVEAADAIYKECDGLEYQLSSITLDLRYIPEDMTFDDPPKDSFSDEQGLVDFKPNYFSSAAMAQGKVNVTWDETEFDRIRSKITNAQRDELEEIVEENHYADNIAPPESDSDFDEDEKPQWLRTALGVDDRGSGSDEGEAISEEKKISLYRKVLMDKLAEDKDKDGKETGIDKELQWTSGMKTAYEAKLKKSEKLKQESQGVVVDKYLERRREKRRQKLQKKTEMAKDGKEEESGGDDDMPDIIDESLKEMMKGEGHDVDSMKNKKKNKKLDKKKDQRENGGDSDAEKEKARLELLLMRDDDQQKLAKPEKVKEKLSRRQKKKISMQKSERRKERREGRLTIDVEDERFGAMFTSHHFHLDPNHGQFRKTKNNMKLVDEQIKRMSKSKKDNSGRNDSGNAEVVEDSRSVSRKLVESLKSKMRK